MHLTLYAIIFKDKGVTNMELFRQIFAIIFYTLIFACIFFKIRNIILVKKMNYKEVYQKIKFDYKQEKMPKKLFKIIIFIVTILGLYLFIGILASVIILFITIFSVGGSAFIGKESMLNFYNALLDYTKFHFSYIEYFGYLVYVVIFLILIRSIFINVKIHTKIVKA